MQIRRSKDSSSSSADGRADIKKATRMRLLGEDKIYT